MTPSSTPPEIGSNTALLVQFLAENPSTSFIRYYWLDYSGVLRARVVPKAQCLQLDRQNQPLRVAAGVCMGMIRATDWPLDYGAGGSDCIYPDWSSLRLLSEEHASVMCDYSEERAAHLGSRGVRGSIHCPRIALKKTIKQAQDLCGVDIIAGFELEFWLVKPGALQGVEPLELSAQNYWSAPFALNDEYGRCVEQCVKNLQKAGVGVEAYHLEMGVQQFEISTAPLPIVSSVDTLIQSQEIVRMTAVAHGLRATFLPKPFPHLAASGLHANISFQRGSDRAEEKLQDMDFQLGDAFLAGVLHRLPLLCAFSMPSQQSYSRIGDGMAGTWVAWGSQNKFIPIRRKGACHFEFRTMDCTANMYIALAAYVGAGLLGIRQQAKLRWHDCEVLLERVDAKTRGEMGIDTQLPASLDESLELLDGSGEDCMALEQVLGKELLSLYRIVKRAEVLILSSMADGQRGVMYSKLF